MRKRHSKEWNALRAWGRGKSMQAVAACGLLLAAGMMQSCDKDILTGQPDSLGNSIYERLQEGITVSDGSQRTFNTTLRLIDELGYTETLSKTGSRTVFATPDDVFDEWFKAKGITYDQLTTAQKNMLFNNSMINNAYLIELMSNVSGNPPEPGLCMRRETYASVYDSIQTYRLADMPVNPLGKESIDAWKKVREEGKDIKILTDATDAPMIHFLPAFMEKNGITGQDLSMVTNGQSTSTNDSWINGKKVISEEQTCKNGYIYVVDGVIDGTQNMAAIINSDPRMSKWASLLNRWSYPEPVTGDALRRYQTTFNTTEPLYNMRYFNSYANHGLKQAAEWDESLGEKDVLKFDPGWNQYGGDKNDLHYDAGVMIVPTNEALDDWWLNGGGKSLRDRFGTWENIPYGTLAPLMNVNMQESFISAVPSRFNTVLNDVQLPLGLTEEHVKECIMGCNGVVYLVDQVYLPGKYNSVIFPTMVGNNSVTAIIDKAINGDYPDPNKPTSNKYDAFSDFSPYLMAVDSRFALIAPYNVTPSLANEEVKGFRYIDPCSYGLAQQNLFEFTFENGMIKGTSYKCTIDDNGNVTVQNSRPTTLQPDVIKNRLNDIIDNSIIIGDSTKTTVIASDQQYYSTKAGSIIKAQGSNSMMSFQGGYQLDYGQNISVSGDYITDMTRTGGNGVTYMVCTDESASNFIGLPQTSTKSVYETLEEEAAKPGSQCNLFLKLLQDPANTNNVSYLRSPMLTRMDGAYKCANNTENYNISIFDNYNYTVYVPTDNAIQDLIDRHILPTWDDFQEAYDSGNEELAEKIVNRIHDFIRYHVQDRALCLSGGDVDEEKYESAKLNPKNNRYYSLTVTANANGYSVKDLVGNTRHVVTSGNFYNKICREYWIKGTPGAVTATLEASSNAVVHQIDGVLFFDSSQMSDWRY